MGVFYFLFIILLLSSVFYNWSRVWGFFLIFLMGFICSFRGIDVGSDTINYYQNNFDETFSIINSSRQFELSFKLLSEYVTYSGIDSRWCLYILSIITYSFLYLAAIRFNRLLGTNVIIMVLLYFTMGYYGMTFNISRQMAAIAILLYGYTFLLQDGKKQLLFFVFLFLASSFHLSSLLYIFVYFLKYLELQKINFRIIAISSLVILFVTQLFKESLLGFVMSKFEFLALYAKYMDQTEESTVSIVGFIFKFVQLLMSLFVYYRLLNCTNRYLLNIYLATIFIGLFFGAFYGNIYRMNIGFAIIQIVAFATYLSEFVYDCSLSPKLKFRITDETAFFILMVMVYGYETLSGLARGAYDVVPYYITF